MSLVTSRAAPLEETFSQVRGAVRFVGPAERAGLHGALTADGLLAVDVARPPWMEASPSGGRRKLRDAIEMAVESALDSCGAPPAGMDIAELDQCLSDQLFRARSIGALGFVLHLPSLLAAGSLSGALDAEDSAVLRWWMAATIERPVVLMLDGANRAIGAYGPPVRLERLVEARRAVDNDARSDDDADETHAENHASAASQAAPIASPDPSNAKPPAPAPVKPKPVPAAIELERVTEPVRRPEKPTRVTASAVPSTPVFERESKRGVIAGEPKPSVIETEPKRSDTAQPSSRVVALFPKRDALPAKSPAFVGRGDAIAASLDWRGFANELEVARGPKPLIIIERLFMSRYIPLMQAVARGEADEAARRTAEHWAENFARSYTEGFSALKVTGKRPRMVLDAPQIGSQIARLHGAKATQLVLVDAMRFDLGVRIHDRMRDALMSQATCTERLLLWSALPTTTIAQLDLLEHGPEALASRTPTSEREEAGLRGRSSTTLRRMRIGSRELFKLDTVEAQLRESGPPLDERLDAIADDVAAVLAAHARNLPPRTLMLVFGDHGFRIESSDTGTLACTSGGASPEEVLVPAFAWLIGDVH